MEARQRPLSASLAEQTRRVALRSGGRASSPPADIRRKTRRRKRDSMRRHTLTGDEDRLSKEEGLRPGGRERLAKERERFLDLLRTRYPDQAEAIASELEWGGDAGKKEEQCNGSVFLQFSGETKRVPLPPQLNLTAIKQLFVATFSPEINFSLMDPPHGAIYIYDSSSALYYELTDFADVRDNAVLAFHPLNPQSSVSPPLSPTEDASQTLQQLNQQLQGNDAQQTNSPFSLDKLHSMEKQLSKLTGLVQQAFLKGQSLGDLVNGDEMAESVLTQTGKKANAAPTASTASRQATHNATERRPPKPKPRWPKGNESKPDLSPANSRKRGDGSLTRWHSGQGPVAPLTVEEKQLVVKAADGVRRNIQLMRSEVEAVRKQHKEQCETFAHFMKEAEEKITKAINLYKPRNIVVNDVERQELIEEEFLFQRCSDSVVQEIKCLDVLVEEIRIDVVNRRCKVDTVELENLSKCLQVSARSLLELRKKFTQLSERLKPVMDSELQEIIREEKMLEEHTPALESAVAKCKKMTGTLAALKRYSTVQQHRAKAVPVIVPSVVDPDRQGVLDNIEAMAPNHLTRMQALEAAKSAYQRKKQLQTAHEMEVTRHTLEASHGKLRRVGQVLQQLESRRFEMVRQWYLEDKQERNRPRAATWSQPQAKQRPRQDRRQPRETRSPYHEDPRNQRHNEWQGRDSEQKVQKYASDGRDRSSHYGYQNGYADREEVEDSRRPHVAVKPALFRRTHSDRRPRIDDRQTGETRRGAGDTRNVISQSYSRAGPSVSYDQSRSASSSSSSVASPKHEHQTFNSNAKNPSQPTAGQRFEQGQSGRHEHGQSVRRNGDNPYARDIKLKNQMSAHRHRRNVQNGDVNLHFVTSDL